MADDIKDFQTHTGDILPGVLTPDGQVRLLASVPGRPSMMATPFSAEPSRIIDRSEWVEFDRSSKRPSVFDQLQMGSCVANGFLYMLLRSMLTAGYSVGNLPQLARAFLYAMINNGRDAGADPADAVQALIETGVCLESELPYRFYRKNQLTSSMFETAKRFRLDQLAVYSLASFDEMVSAELLGFDTGFTIRVGAGFNNLDGDGCPGVARGVGNHWMSSDNRLKKNARGEWLLGALQSWGPQWGVDNGRCFTREAHFTNQSYVQMYAIKWPGQDPMDPNIAPVVAA